MPDNGEDIHTWIARIHARLTAYGPMAHPKPKAGGASAPGKTKQPRMLSTWSMRCAVVWGRQKKVVQAKPRNQHG
jgi:hypothetical protein